MKIGKTEVPQTDPELGPHSTPSSLARSIEFMDEDRGSGCPDHAEPVAVEVLPAVLLEKTVGPAEHLEILVFAMDADGTEGLHGENLIDAEMIPPVLGTG